MVRIADLVLKAACLAPLEQPVDRPLVFVDLDDTTADSELNLPPCPVIGLGARNHPLAPLLDAVIEPPVTAQSVVRQVLAAPRAAAVTVELLRLVPELQAQQALVVESMAYGVLQGSAEHRAWLAGRSPAAARPSPGEVRVDRSGNRLSIILARPDSGNAIDRTMRDQLHEAFSLASIDGGIESIILSGAGRSFSLGAELDEFGTTIDPASAHAIRARTLPSGAIARCADRLEVHVRGACVGAGLEMAAWGRRITASPDAWFQLPELAMGILPGAGGCVSLSRRIGRQRTALMILSGKRIGARTALDWGLVDALVHEPA